LPEAAPRKSAGLPPERDGSEAPLGEADPEHPPKRRRVPVGIKLLSAGVLIIAALWLVAHFRR
jgi:hypothetical protein